MPFGVRSVWVYFFWGGSRMGVREAGFGAWSRCLFSHGHGTGCWRFQRAGRQAGRRWLVEAMDMSVKKLFVKSH